MGTLPAPEGAQDAIRWRGAIDGLERGVWVIQADGIVLEANPAAGTALGLGAEAIRGKPLWTPSWWRDGGAAMERLREIIARARAGNPASGALVAARGDGRAISLSVKRLRAGDGPDGPLLVEERPLPAGALDAPEAQGLDHERERLDLTLQATGSGVWEWGFGRGMDYWSPEVLVLLGLDPAQPISSEQILELIHPDDQARIGSTLKEAIQGREAHWQGEFRVSHPGRGLCWISTTGKITYDGQGRPARLLGVSSDITERKQAEGDARFLAEMGDAVRTLDDPEELLRTATRSIAEHLEAVWCMWTEIDPATGAVAVRGEHHPGHPPLDGVSGVSGLSPALVEELRAGRAIACPDASLDPRLEARYAERYRPAGVRGFVAVPLLRNGRWVSALWVSTNMPRMWRRQEVELLEAAAEQLWFAYERGRLHRALRDADRRKDEFLAMMAHELRNPLAPIQSAIELLQALGPPEPALQSARDIISRQVGHMKRLLDDLLEVSRITQGRITLKMESVELDGIIQRAIETSRPVLEARNHRLTVTVPSKSVVLQGDATRLAQALANLLDNAAKFTPNGGDIRLTVEAGLSDVVLGVGDNGGGISADLLPHVFDLFVQADRGPARREGGLGLGLHVVRRLVEMHGGVVEARSEGQGKGSTFLMRLPRLPDRNTQSAESGGPRVTAGGGDARLRVLVVDDNEDVARSMAMLLKVQGHDVRTAPDGPSALDAVREFLPQVVLADIGLPGMSGYEVARRMRELPETRRTKLIAVTGYGQDRDREESREAGFDIHLVKPVSLEVLREALGAAAPLRKSLP